MLFSFCLFVCCFFGGCCFVVVFFVCCCLLLFWGVFGVCGFRGFFFLIRWEGCLFGYFVVGPDLPTCAP